MDSVPEYPQVISLRSSTSVQPPNPPPAAPDHLTEGGAEVWNELAPLYVLTDKDLVEFAAYCESVAEFREASGIIDDSGIAVVDPASGLPVANPVLSIRSAADRKIAFWAGRFK